MKKHLQWFPFIIFGLTVILAVTIVIVDRGRNGEVEIVVAEDVLPIGGVDIDAEEYKLDVKETLSPVWATLSVGDGSVDRVVLVRDRMLATVVPGEYREVHLGVVIALNKLILGLEGDDEALAEAQVRFTNLEQAEVWMR